MRGSQKVSDILINRKVPSKKRNEILVLCDNERSGDGERILWVVGQRRSRHALIGPETTQVVWFTAES